MLVEWLSVANTLRVSEPAQSICMRCVCSLAMLSPIVCSPKACQAEDNERRSREDSNHQAEYDALKAEVARLNALVGADDNDAVMSGLQTEIAIKAQEVERVRDELKTLAAAVAASKAEADSSAAEVVEQRSLEDANHQAECDELKAEVARLNALVGADGDAGVKLRESLTAQSRLKVSRQNSKTA